MTDPCFIKGTCETMCPNKELRMRKKENLLHFFEINPSSNNNQEIKAVKEFTRSAAGVQQPKSSDLRTEKSLQRTVQYLLTNILADKRKPFYYIYDFIFDRLRSVRQEIVMQNLNLPVTINLIEPMVLFLAYSYYRLCDEPIGNFDPKICNQHLQECLQKLLCGYDEIDVSCADQTIYNIERREFFESIYLVLNLGSFDALNRALNLPRIIRNRLFQLCFTISLEYWNNNYYKVLMNIQKLPLILCAVASLNLQEIRRHMLIRFSYAYDSKVLSVPITWMSKILLYSNNHLLIADCKYYNIDVNMDQQSIKFCKRTFDYNICRIKPRREDFVDDLFKNENIRDILLLLKF